MTKPSLPQGTRDFGPETVRKRNYILQTIRNVFEAYGFVPLETPAMEYLDTLLGKYGEEGDKLIFKILNNGLSDPKHTDKAKAAFENVIQGKNDKNLTEKALKYDLTIPFARYVAMNHGVLHFPFKRYQIQPVWRADRPQKGRYREFYQCDADVAGSNSLTSEVELIHMYHDVFTRLQIFDHRLQINNRKILTGVMQVCGLESLERKILVIIDKTDKIGKEGVRKELENEGIPSENLEKLLRIYSYSGLNHETISFLQEALKGSETGLKGVSEISYILERLDYYETPSLQSGISLDLTLARGLEYYTGTILEARAPAAVKIGSIGGGGRYDDLTGLFGLAGMPGVGISFGVDRIYDVIEELLLFPESIHVGTQVLFLNSGERAERPVTRVMQKLRNKGIRCEMFHEQSKPEKQYKYAEKKNIPFVVKDIADEACTIKNIKTGDQITMTIDNLLTMTF